MLEASAGSLNGFVYAYSILLKHLETQTTSNSIILQRDSATHQIRKITAINVPLITLYSYAYSKELFGFEVNVRNLPQNNRIVVATRNPLDVRWPASDSLLDDWNGRNLWSYEAQVKPASKVKLPTVIQTDLQNYSGFEAKIQTRTMSCLVLKRTSQLDKLQTTNKTQSPEAYSNEGFVVRNMPLKQSLLPHLVIACQEIPFPVVDETAYANSVDMELRAKSNKLKDLNQALRRYDLALTVERRDVKVLVIRDKTYSSR